MAEPTQETPPTPAPEAPPETPPTPAPSTPPAAKKAGLSALSDQPAGTEKPAEPKWHWADGVPGEGEPPEWLRSDKYKSVEAQAKAFVGLEKKLGNVPVDGYKLNVPKDVTEAGASIDAEAAEVKDLFALAKKHHVSQEALDDIVGLYARARLAESSGDDLATIATMKAELGAAGIAQARQIMDWARSNLPPELADAVDRLPSRAEDVYTIASLLQHFSSSAKEKVRDGGDGSVTEVDRLKAEIDADMKDPRYRSDPKFAAAVSKKFEKWRELDPAAFPG